MNFNDKMQEFVKRCDEVILIQKVKVLRII
jgi:hypothetical protein